MFQNILYKKKEMRDFPQRWVLPVAIIALTVPIIYILYGVLRTTKGVFSYPLDDVFIHMAIAKNLSLHGVWGISQYEFVSASSSILYPLIIAGIFLFTGPLVIVPFIVNFIAAVFLLIILQKWLRSQGLQAMQQLTILLAVISLTPLPILVIVAMEHILQILFCFLFITAFAENSTENIENNRKTWIFPWYTFAYAMSVTATRYEGMFLIAAACFVLLLHRQLFAILQLTVFSGIPMLLYGFISIYNKNFFFPNSVLLKSIDPDSRMSGIRRLISKESLNKLYYFTPTLSAVATSYMLMIAVIMFILRLGTLKKEILNQIILWLISFNILLQVMLSATGWFFRYESYLITLSCVALGPLLARTSMQPLDHTNKARWLISIFLAFVLVAPLIIRAKDAYRSTKRTCLDIYNLEYHIAEFLRQNYDNTTVAVNDIGAISYYTTGKKIDLWGLGNAAIAGSILNRYNSTAFTNNLITKEKVKIAIVFNRLNDPYLLAKWKKIATWRMLSYTTLADSDITFYAVDSTISENLSVRLRSYQSKLTANTIVHYY